MTAADRNSASLAAVLRARIAAEGSISVFDYMAACNGDPAAGYYTTREPIGAQGDFITAPEISQIFGELVGLWCVAVWQLMGSSSAITIAELGPGRGTLLTDAIRAWRSVPEFLQHASLALVETSPTLRVQQTAALADCPMPLKWVASVEEIAPGPLIVIANEFLDALPVRQFIRRDGAWRERHVGCAADGTFVFVEDKPVDLGNDAVEASEGDVLEMRPGDANLIAALAAHAKQSPLAALIIDYGHVETASGDTLQAVRAHHYADPLAAPGESDLTAHVDFAKIERLARKNGLRCFGPLPQGEFLLKLGLAERRDALLRSARPQQRNEIVSGASRLVDPREMGLLFKVLALTSAALPAPPPF